MKRVLIGVMVFVLWVSGLTFHAAAEEARPTASGAVGVFSKYIWRGFELSDGPVIQPTATIGYKGFSMNLWGNLDLDRDDMDPTTTDKTEWTETDWTLDYTHDFGPVKVGVGYIYYSLDAIDDSQEIYVGAALNVFLSPTLTVYREVAHAPGWYTRFGLSHSFAIGGGVTLDLAGSVSYFHSDDDAIVEVGTTDKYRSFHDGNLSVGVKIPIGKYFVVNPVLAYSFPLSNEAEEFIKASSLSDDADFLYGGVVVSMSF